LILLCSWDELRVNSIFIASFLNVIVGILLLCTVGNKSVYFRKKFFWEGQSLFDLSGKEVCKMLEMHMKDLNGVLYRY